MRMEAKHNYFKKVAQVGNFKNIAYSLAHRHQRLVCSYIQEDDFFSTKAEYGPGSDVNIRNIHDFIIIDFIIHKSLAQGLYLMSLKSLKQSYSGYYHTRRDCQLQGT